MNLTTSQLDILIKLLEEHFVRFDNSLLSYHELYEQLVEERKNSI